ncbi:MAG: hypothetical protein CSA33_04230 [Desulfobulbus propionicus]|nr:MAG: hypothetical protein CSA33_04230 [Desulfobulbus propionicus]
MHAHTLKFQEYREKNERTYCCYGHYSQENFGKTGADQGKKREKMDKNHHQKTAARVKDELARKAA